MGNFDVNGMKNEVMARIVEDGTHITQKFLKIQDNLLEDKEKEMDHEKIQYNMDVHPRWNNFIEYSTMIMPMEKQECLVSKTSSRLHDDQSLEIQLEGLPSRGEDQRCIQKLENLILQIFENKVINAMPQEAELILKSEIFDEAWLFGYVLSSRDVGHARNLRV